MRFFLLRTHYRSALNYSDAHIDDARSGLKRLYTALSSIADGAAMPLAAGEIDWTNPFAARFRAAMDEDFGTPEAIAVLFDLASEVNRSKTPAAAQLLRALGACLGLLQQDPTAYLQAGAALSEDQILALIEERAAAKAGKDFARADAIRQQLQAASIVLKDSAGKTTWEVVQ